MTAAESLNREALLDIAEKAKDQQARASSELRQIEALISTLEAQRGEIDRRIGVATRGKLQLIDLLADLAQMERETGELLQATRPGLN